MKRFVGVPWGSEQKAKRKKRAKKTHRGHPRVAGKGLGQRTRDGDLVQARRRTGTARRAARSCAEKNKMKRPMLKRSHTLTFGNAEKLFLHCFPWFEINAMSFFTMYFSLFLDLLILPGCT